MCLAVVPSGGDLTLIALNQPEAPGRWTLQKDARSSEESKQPNKHSRVCCLEEASRSPVILGEPGHFFRRHDGRALDAPATRTCRRMEQPSELWEVPPRHQTGYTAGEAGLLPYRRWVTATGSPWSRRSGTQFVSLGIVGWSRGGPLTLTRDDSRRPVCVSRACGCSSVWLQV